MSQLKTHLLWHSEERPYTCEYGKRGKRFRSDELLRYNRTHTDEKRHIYVTVASASGEVITCPITRKVTSTPILPLAPGQHLQTESNGILPVVESQPFTGFYNTASGRNLTYTIFPTLHKILSSCVTWYR